MRIGAAWTYVRSELRRRWPSLLALAAIVAIGSGVATGALVLADRTDRAYPDYVRDAEVNPLVVNPSIASEAVDAEIRAFPGVTSVHSHDTFLAATSDTDGGTLRELLANRAEGWTDVRGSSDGGYIDVDRPAVTEGALPTGARELFVSEEYRPTLEAIQGRSLHVGDVVDLAFYESYLGDIPLAPSGEPVGFDPNEVIEPVGVEPMTIVGFGRLSDEVLTDEAYPRERMILSADVADRYRCTFEPRADMTPEETEGLGQGCSTQYRYYSLGLEDGTSVSELRERFGEVGERLNEDLPADLRAEGVGYYFVSQDRTDLDDAVHQTTKPTVWALVVFGIVSGLATVVVVALVAVRVARRSDGDQRSLMALGATVGTRTIAVGGAALSSVVLGSVGGLAVAWAVSRIGPLGSVRHIVPSVDLGLPATVVVPVLAVILLTMVLCVGLSAYREVRRSSRPDESLPRRLPGWIGRWRAGRPGVSIGVRAAFGERRSDTSAAVLGGCVVAVMVTVAAAVFGSNVALLADSPPRYGWPWQAAVVTGGGYGDAVPDAVASTLEGRPEVVRTDFYGFDPAALVEGSAVPTVFGFEGSEESPFAVVDGRPAAREGEIVLGARTAEELGLEIGDDVTFEATQVAVTDAELVGTAVLPAIGSFAADRSGLGVGAFMPVAVDPADDSEGSYPAALVALRLTDGTEPGAFLDSLDGGTAAWDYLMGPLELRHPVRPPEIVDISDMEGAPLLLAGLLSAALAAGLALSIAVSVRDRRRDLAVLRALGLSSRELGSAVRWQALTTVVVGLLVGIPLGIVAGRLAWRRFADQLGLVPRADIPWTWLAGIVVAAIVLGLLAALLPGRAAARVRPAAILHRQ